jgi:hypothetical protein
MDAGTNDQPSTAALGPKLAENQADFVGQQGIPAEGGVQGEQSGVNLMRV